MMHPVQDFHTILFQINFCLMADIDSLYSNSKKLMNLQEGHNDIYFYPCQKSLYILTRHCL